MTTSLAAMPNADETPSEAVARRLRGKLAERRISGTGLGRMIGVSRSSMSRLLNGEYPFDIEQLYRIEETTGITVMSLLGVKNDESPSGGGPEGQSGPAAGAGRNECAPRDSNPEPIDYGIDGERRDNVVPMFPGVTPAETEKVPA